MESVPRPAGSFCEQSGTVALPVRPRSRRCSRVGAGLRIRQRKSMVFGLPNVQLLFLSQPCFVVCLVCPNVQLLLWSRPHFVVQQIIELELQKLGICIERKSTLYLVYLVSARQLLCDMWIWWHPGSLGFRVTVGSTPYQKHRWTHLCLSAVSDLKTNSQKLCWLQFAK